MWAIFPLENEFVHIERIEIGEIPCLKFKPKGKTGPLPTVIYYHGWHSSKEYQRYKGASMATYGYQVIVPDALHHGERNPIDHDAPKMLETYLWKIILQNVKESGIIIDSIIEKHDADPHRIGIMGSSMGGFSGAGVFIHNPNLKCFVNFNGSCAWLCTEEIFRQRTQRPFMEESFVADLSQFDPMCNKDKLKERPILMLHGDADSSVPISCQRMFYSEVAPLYKDDPERLKLEEIPRMDHYISTGMLEEGIMWLKKYL